MVQGENSNRYIGISVKIILILSISFVLVEGIILYFTGGNRREEMENHYRFQASILSQTVAPESRSDQDYLDRLAERMSDEKVLSVVPAAGAVAEEYSVEDGVMTFRGNELEMRIDVSEIDAAVRSYAWGIVGLVAIILVFLVATAFPFMHVFLVKPLRALLANLENISGAEGDLTQRLKVQSNDEIGRIAAAFNAFVERIQEVVTEMKAASDSGKDIGQTLMEATQDSAHRLGEVSAAAETNGTRLESLNGEIQASAASVNEISASVENMTVVAETQAQEVADSLAAVEQMNASIANLAQIANKRREGAQTLVSTAQDANDKMSESVRSIAEMEKSTEDLLGLIDVINGIASQTNLLSMNAAIEAAHAGEAGKGFAVVAEEIRNLAEQTAEHAKTIGSTLKLEAEKIAFAGQNNRAAGNAFDQIVVEIQNVTESMSEIVAGMNEQSVASNEIMRAVTALDQIASEVRTAAKEIDSSTTSLSNGIDRVSNVSGEVTSELQQIITEVQAVNQGMAAMSDAGSENEKNILRLNSQVKRFVV